MPTGIWHLRLRSGSAHCDLALAVEVAKERSPDKIQQPSSGRWEIRHDKALKKERQEGTSSN